jgi:hypothetical protein
MNTLQLVIAAKRLDCNLGFQQPASDGTSKLSESRKHGVAS